MDTTMLGTTGLRVTVMGLGCGGHSRLGLSTGRTEQEAEAVVRAALDLDVNIIDTAEGYGTEEVVGRALRGMPRERIVLSTKAGVDRHGQRSTAAEMRERVEACLRRLGTEYVDVFHLHGVSPDEYDYAASELVPALLDMRAQGKIRFLGITEQFAADPQHRMLARALEDDCWQVVMVGFNLLNQSARERVLAKTREKGIGTLCMFAVRRALSQWDVLLELMDRLADQGLLDPGEYDPDDPLSFLLNEGGAASLPDAAYRFCRYEPGLNVILSGTGSVEHLKVNAASLNAPPLPEAVVERLRRLFARVDSVSGN